MAAKDVRFNDVARQRSAIFGSARTNRRRGPDRRSARSARHATAGSECQHSIALRAGLPSVSGLGTSSEDVSKPKAAGRLTERSDSAKPATILR